MKLWPPDDMPLPAGGFTAECGLCLHGFHQHTQILEGYPCLECDCIGFTEPRRPDPTIIQGWRCPICATSTMHYGIERRRVGRWPWKRRVHIDCQESS